MSAAEPTIQFSSVNNPTTWTSDGHDHIEFANHAEAKKAEEIFGAMSRQIATLAADRSALASALQGMIDSYEHEASSENPALLNAREAMLNHGQPSA